jgi:hypothetical protein
MAIISTDSSPTGKSVRRVALAAVGTTCLVLSGNAVAAAPNNCDRCFAMVRANATVVYQRGVAATAKLGPSPGGYAITFAYPINNCAVSATIDSVSTLTGVPYTSTLVVQRRSTKRVDVFTLLSNVLYDGSFSLAVTC